MISAAGAQLALHAPPTLASAAEAVRLGVPVEWIPFAPLLAAVLCGILALRPGDARARFSGAICVAGLGLAFLTSVAVAANVGHGLLAARVSGGRGMISSWVIDAAPCRLDVPIQSDPVSPPPITITCLPLAVMEPFGAALASLSPATRRFCWTRKSMAK